jgi:hypothetical protein
MGVTFKADGGIFNAINVRCIMQGKKYKAQRTESETTQHKKKWCPSCGLPSTK